MDLSIRDLYNKILDFKGKNLLDELLIQWVTDNNYTEFILTIKQQYTGSIENCNPDEFSRELYALSRVLDILTLRFQIDNRKDGSDWQGPEINVEEYSKFIEILGCKITNPKVFTSFHCEIIEAKEDQENYQLKSILFPAVILGKLLIKKAGVITGFNTKDYNLSLINNAKIYWAFRRKNRSYQDLSHGWGHNSQWQTDFRFDLETQDSFIYNLYGSDNLFSVSEELKHKLEENNLELEEAIELTRNRHFISTQKNDEDLFPYDFNYIELKNTLDN